MSTKPELNEFQRKAFKLCLAVYRLVDYFPEKEIISNQTKELANVITADILAIERIGSKIPLNIPASSVRNLFDEMILSIIKNIEKLIGFFYISRAKNWVNPKNFDILISEYKKLEAQMSAKPSIVITLKEVKQAAEEEMVYSTKAEQEPPSHSKTHFREIKKPLTRVDKTKELNPRQKKLLEIITKQKEARMSDFLAVFKNTVTERTLRNDLRDLAEKGLVKAEGDFKTRRYFIK